MRLHVVVDKYQSYFMKPQDIQKIPVVSFTYKIPAPSFTCYKNKIHASAAVQFIMGSGISFAPSPLPPVIM
jgi:hypothetical protein